MTDLSKLSKAELVALLASAQDEPEAQEDDKGAKDGQGRALSVSVEIGASIASKLDAYSWLYVTGTKAEQEKGEAFYPTKNPDAEVSPAQWGAIVKRAQAKGLTLTIDKDGASVTK